MFKVTVIYTKYSDGSSAYSLRIGNASGVKITAKAAKQIINDNALLCSKTINLKSGTVSYIYGYIGK